MNYAEGAKFDASRGHGGDDPQGRVCARCRGKNYAESQSNRAGGGSASRARLSAVVYLAALERGLTRDDPGTSRST